MKDRFVKNYGSDGISIYDKEEKRHIASCIYMDHELDIIRIINLLNKFNNDSEKYTKAYMDIQNELSLLQEEYEEFKADSYGNLPPIIQENDNIKEAMADYLLAYRQFNQVIVFDNPVLWNEVAPCLERITKAFSKFNNNNTSTYETCLTMLESFADSLELLTDDEDWKTLEKTDFQKEMEDFVECHNTRVELENKKNE